MLPKYIIVVFHTGSNYDYHFIIKDLTKQFKEEFICVGENTGKYKTFSVPTTEEVKIIGKRETTKNTSPYLTNYGLLIAQGLWQANYQILLIILLKEVIKINASIGMMIKNMKLVELNKKIVSAALNT